MTGSQALDILQKLAFNDAHPKSKLFSRKRYLHWMRLYRKSSFRTECKKGEPFVGAVFATRGRAYSMDENCAVTISQAVL